MKPQFLSLALASAVGAGIALADNSHSGENFVSETPTTESFPLVAGWVGSNGKQFPSQPWVKLSLTTGSFTTQTRLWISIDRDKAPNGTDPQLIGGKGSTDLLSILCRWTTKVNIDNPGLHTFNV